MTYRPRQITKPNRRRFLQTAGAAAFVPYFVGSKASANVAKNDRPRIGCIGTGSMGMGDAEQHARFGDIVAVCDVDSFHCQRAKCHDGSVRGWPTAMKTTVACSTAAISTSSALSRLTIGT